MSYSKALRPAVASLLALVSAVGCATADVGVQGEHESEVREAVYLVTRQDMRECVFPACGGVFVAEVNAAETLCANGERAAECYVSAFDWSALAPGEAAQSALDQAASARELVLRGRLDDGDGYGRLRVVAAQRTVAGSALGTDSLYTVRFNGLMCATSPCPSFDAVLVNSDEVERVAAVNLDDVAMSDAEHEAVYAAMGSDAGLVVAATPIEVSGLGGTAKGLKASSALLPIVLDSQTCPDDSDPSVRYASHDPDTCRVILFHCDEGQEYFGGACGCGCVGVE